MERHGGGEGKRERGKGSLSLGLLVGKPIQQLYLSLCNFHHFLVRV